MNMSPFKSESPSGMPQKLKRKHNRSLAKYQRIETVYRSLYDQVVRITGCGSLPMQRSYQNILKRGCKRVSLYEALGKKLRDLGEELGPNNLRVEGIIAVGQTLQVLGQQENQLAINIVQHFLVYLNHILETKLKVMKPHFKRLQRTFHDWETASAKREKSKLSSQKQRDPAVSRANQHKHNVQVQHTREAYFNQRSDVFKKLTVLTEKDLLDLRPYSKMLQSHLQFHENCQRQLRGCQVLLQLLSEASKRDNRSIGKIDWTSTLK